MRVSGILLAGSSLLMSTILGSFALGGEPPSLHEAAKHSDVAAIKKLLDADADVNAKDDEGWTPLHWAALQGNEDTVRTLLAGGAKVDTPGGNGEMLKRPHGKGTMRAENWTPLHMAAYRGNAAVVELLLAGGADVNAVGEYPRLQGWRRCV